MASSPDRVRAIIFQDNLVLLIFRIKNGQQYWAFPGGGVEPEDASPLEAVKRECLEELSLNVEPDATEVLRTTYNGESSYFYRCRVTGGTLGYGDGPEFSHPEAGTYVFAWIPAEQITKLPSVYPAEAVAYVADHHPRS